MVMIMGEVLRSVGRCDSSQGGVKSNDRCVT